MTEPRVHALVIDDDAAFLTLLRDLLGEEGFRVTALTEPPADLAEVVAPPNVVILDLVYGGRATGWEFLERLKADERTARVPVLVCTALGIEDDGRARLAALGVPVIAKPFDLDAFLAALGETVEDGRSRNPPWGGDGLPQNEFSTGAD